nr:hypothetical protein [Tanacetum cinerariifolium]
LWQPQLINKLCWMSPLFPAHREAEQLKIILKRSRQETHISQQSGSSTDERTGSKPGVPYVPSDDSEEELSWNSFDDEDVGGHEEGNKSDESDDDRDEGRVKAGAGKDDDDDDDEDNDEEEELAKSDEEEESGKGGDEVRESEGESDEEQEEEESFDPIPRTPEESEEESYDEKEHDLRLSEEATIQEEEDADELYRDVNINQGKGLQVTQNVEDTHVTLTPVNPDGPQESSSMSLFIEKESDDEEEQESRLSEEERIQEEEDANELYRDVNINQGRGLQVTQNVEDTHVILTPVNPDGPQESSSMSSFVSSMLNPISDVRVESIFTTKSSPIVSLEPPTPIMTPSTIATR